MVQIACVEHLAVVICAIEFSVSINHNPLYLIAKIEIVIRAKSWVR